MINRQFIFSMGLMVGLILLTMACEKDKNKTLVSYFNGNDSHKTGQNCMDCHVSGGSGDGIFTTAGSVYDVDKLNPYTNASIRVYIGPNGTGDLVKTIEGDGKGNFYTTEFLDFSEGLYVSVSGDSGEEEHMVSMVTSGACNSCHGSSTNAR